MNPHSLILSAVLSGLFKPFLLFLLVLAITLLLKLYYPRIKGAMGENRTSKGLERLPEDHRVINDLLLETERGSSQIDHTVISPHGIFVIETKTYDGWIFGDEDSTYWTQVIYKTKKKFHNPVRQNYGHVQALKSVLVGRENVPYHPVIVFGGGCELKKVTTSTPVIYRKQLADFILDSKRDVVLSGEDIEQIYAVLVSANRQDRKARKEHITNIQAGKARRGLA